MQQKSHKMDYHGGSDELYPKKVQKLDRIHFHNKKNALLESSSNSLMVREQQQQTLWEFCCTVFALNCWNFAATETIVPHNCSNRPYSLLFASCKLLPFQNCWICSVQRGNNDNGNEVKKSRQYSFIVFASVYHNHSFKHAQHIHTKKRNQFETLAESAYLLQYLPALIVRMWQVRQIPL